MFFQNRPINSQSMGHTLFSQSYRTADASQIPRRDQRASQQTEAMISGPKSDNYGTFETLASWITRKPQQVVALKSYAGHADHLIRQ
jgi:hypothetical protein